MNTFQLPNIIPCLLIFTGIAFFIENFILKYTKLTEILPKKNIFFVCIRKINKNASSFFYVLIIVFFIRTVLFEPFFVPSESMNPTLISGDFILSKKFSYGIRNPLNNHILMSTYFPNRGDIVVFKYPKCKTINFVKRIIGIPGDYIKYDFKKKKLLILPMHKLINKQKLKVLTKYNYISQKNPNSIEIRTNETILSQKNKKFYKKIFSNMFYKEIKKELLEKNLHEILINGLLIDDNNSYFKQKNLHLGEWIVPKKAYFVMGDYRDNSLDSRYWGFVSEDNLIGKINSIWMSIEKNTKTWWPIHFRFDRIGFIT